LRSSRTRASRRPTRCFAGSRRAVRGAEQRTGHGTGCARGSIAA
jgi:hypothetical protein